jgi:glutamine synthetase
VPGFEAPVNCFFSSGNRSAAIRVPKYATQPDKVRFEFRPPDATCNPYLAMAAMLMAGLDGIQNQIDPTAAGFGPFNEDIFNWSPERRAQIKNLPTSLGEACAGTRTGPRLPAGWGCVRREMIADWIRAKLHEDREVRTRPHPYEVELYFDL